MDMVELTLDDARELLRLLSQAVTDVGEAETSRTMKPRAVIYVPGDSQRKLAITGARRT